MRVRQLVHTCAWRHVSTARGRDSKQTLQVVPVNTPGCSTVTCVRQIGQGNCVFSSSGRLERQRLVAAGLSSVGGGSSWDSRGVGGVGGGVGSCKSGGRRGDGGDKVGPENRWSRAIAQHVNTPPPRAPHEWQWCAVESCRVYVMHPTTLHVRPSGIVCVSHEAPPVLHQH